MAGHLALAGADFDPDIVGRAGQFFEDAILPGRIVEEVLAEFLAGHGNAEFSKFGACGDVLANYRYTMRLGVWDPSSRTTCPFSATSADGVPN